MENKIAELSQKITDGVSTVFTSDKYKSYLKQASIFHNYSFRNMMLIFLQKDNATQVAGFTTWNKLNRKINKGEKGIAIFAPCKLQKKIIDEDGNEEVDIKIRFKAVSVFDISQTNGEPLKSICDSLSGDVKDYKVIFDSVKNISPCKINFENISGGARGYYSPTDNKIGIKYGMSDEQTLKTLFHEIAHATLQHDVGGNKSIKEIQAESVAFMMCDHFGVDSSSYSFEYIANWSNTEDVAVLQETLTTIHKTATELIYKVDKSIEEIKKSTMKITENKSQQSLSDKLSKAKVSTSTKPVDKLNFENNITDLN